MAFILLLYQGTNQCSIIKIQVLTAEEMMCWNEPEKDSDGIADNYEDDFDEIEEDLPENDDDEQVDEGVAKSGNIAGSGHGITASQSLGVDPSVDSLALEDYDHVEPVERLN